jgi:hypothetical protein
VERTALRGTCVFYHPGESGGVVYLKVRENGVGENNG